MFFLLYYLLFTVLWNNMVNHQKGETLSLDAELCNNNNSNNENKQTLQQTIFGFGKAVVNCKIFTRRSFPNTRQTRTYKTLFEISYESAFKYFARSCVKRTFTRNVFVKIRYFVSGEKRRIRVAHVFVLG